MKNYFLLLFMITLHFIAEGQTYSSDNPAYIESVTAGEKALLDKEYDDCMVYYRRAFNIQQTSVISTLRMAACAYSGGYQYEYNKQLSKAVELNWGGATNIFDGSDQFAYLKGTSFEDKLKSLAKAKAVEDGVNFELMEELADILVTDQLQRGVMRNYEWGSLSMDSLWVLQNYSDSVNTIRIIEIIEEYGYPGKSLVGQGQSGTAFLVIQHADIEVQEKYLPVLTKAAEEGELRWSSLALLIDRVALRQGKKQIYGSQIGRTQDGEYYVSPLEDPENVDQRREEVGLGPLNDYCQNWDFTFDIDNHKRIWADLKQIEKEIKK